LANTHLQGLELALVCLTIAVIILTPILGPHLFKRSGKDIIYKMGKESIDKLLKEKEMFIEENNAIIKSVSSSIAKINEALIADKKEHDSFYNTTIERFDSITKQVAEYRESEEKWHLRALRNSVQNENAPRLIRMTDFREYIQHGGNHDLNEYAFQHVLLPDRKLWNSLFCSPDDLSDVPLKYREHYKETMASLNRRFNDGFILNKK
jgi:hypothetical protein